MSHNNFPDSVIFLWQFQDENFSSRPDIFGDNDDGSNGDGNNWAESWNVMKILRGHLQVKLNVVIIVTQIIQKLFSYCCLTHYLIIFRMLLV